MHALGPFPRPLSSLPRTHPRSSGCEAGRTAGHTWSRQAAAPGPPAAAGPPPPAPPAAAAPGCCCCWSAAGRAACHTCVRRRAQRRRTARFAAGRTCRGQYREMIPDTRVPMQVSCPPKHGCCSYSAHVHSVLLSPERTHLGCLYSSVRVATCVRGAWARQTQPTGLR